MSVEFNNNNNENENEEVEEASTSSSLPIDGEEDKTDPNLMSPSLCKDGMVKHFDNLVSHFSSIWKHHVANTNGIKESWLKFEDFYSNICQFTGGQSLFKNNLSKNKISLTTKMMLKQFSLQDL